MTTYSSLPNKLASAVNGIDYAYRDAGEGPVPLVLLQHFRGNLDNWGGRDQVLTRQPQTPPAHIRLAAPLGQRGTGDLRQYAKNGKNESSNTLSNRRRLSRYDDSGVSPGS